MNNNNKNKKLKKNNSNELTEEEMDILNDIFDGETKPLGSLKLTTDPNDVGYYDPKNPDDPRRYRIRLPSDPGYPDLPYFKLSEKSIDNLKEQLKDNEQLIENINEQIEEIERTKQYTKRKEKRKKGGKKRKSKRKGGDITREFITPRIQQNRSQNIEINMEENNNNEDEEELAEIRRQAAIRRQWLIDTTNSIFIFDLYNNTLTLDVNIINSINIDSFDELIDYYYGILRTRLLTHEDMEERNRYSSRIFLIVNTHLPIELNPPHRDILITLQSALMRLVMQQNNFESSSPPPSPTQDENPPEPDPEYDDWIASHTTSVGGNKKKKSVKKKKRKTKNHEKNFK